MTKWNKNKKQEAEKNWIKRLRKVKDLGEKTRRGEKGGK